MAGIHSRPVSQENHPGGARRGFRNLNFFSDVLSVGSGDMFSGGSDLELHENPDAFASVQKAELGEISICRVRSSGHDVRVREPHALTLIVPLSGAVTIEDDYGRTTAGPGGALLAPIGRRNTRVDAGATTPFVGVPLLIPALSLGRKLRHAGLDRTVALNGSRSALHAEAIRLVGFLHDELRNGAGLMRRPAAEASYAELVKEIIGDVLDQPGNAPRYLDVSGRVLARRVRAAEDFMLANLAEITAVADVARELRVSVRTLELAFRSVHDLSPHQYLASLRVTVAHRLLLSDPDIASVTEACLACGIGHAGRFATAYRKRYGQSPSETLRRR